MTENMMKEILLEKVTLNIGAGESGPKLEKSKAILEKISGGKAVITSTKRRSTFGVAKGKPIGVKVTIRGKGAEDLLRRLIQGRDNKLKPSFFDSTGSFSFGVAEYINIPGIKYDPDVGIMGLDVAVTLTRRGYRVKKRKMRPGKVGKSHKIKPEEAMEFIKSKFGAELVEKEDRYVL
jgi:large subunit ribosomal protein L5